MLSRTVGTGRRSTSPLYLPFLAPSYAYTLSRANSTSASTPWYKELARKKWPRKSDLQPNSSTQQGPISFALPKAAKIGNKPAVTKVGSDPLQDKTIRERVHEFLFTLQGRDAKPLQHLRDVLRSWKFLQDTGVLVAFGPNDLARASSLMSTLTATLASETLSRNDFLGLEEIAINLAVRDAPDALIALLVLLLRQSKPEAADTLLYRFHDKWSKPFKDDMASPHLKPSVTRDDYLSDVEYTLDAAPTREPRCASDMLSAVIAAHAERADLRSAVRVALRLGYTIQMASANSFLSSLGLEASHYERARHFVTHARTANLARDSTHLIGKIITLQGLGHQYLRSVQQLYTTVVEALGDEYPWATLSPIPTPERSIVIGEDVFIHFIDAFYHLKRLDLVSQVWDDLARLGHKPSVKVWAALIRGGGVLRGADYAQVLWDSMQSSGVQPDVSAYYGLINAYARDRRMREATARLNELQAFLKKSPAAADAPILERLYNAMLVGYLGARMHEEALGFLKQMKQRGPAPTTFTYNTLMAHYNRAGDFKSLSWALKSIAEDGLEADGFTYSTLLSALLKVEKHDDAVAHVMDIMQKHGVQPNAAMYSTIIRNLLEQRTVEALLSAMDILRWMEASPERTLAPTVATYTNILQTVHGSAHLPADVRDSCLAHVREQMQSRRIEFTKPTYTILINACLQSEAPNGTEEGLRYFRKMQAAGLPIYADVWYVVIQGLARRQEWALAKEVVSEMLRAHANRKGQGEDNAWLMKLARRVEQRRVDDSAFEDVYRYY